MIALAAILVGAAILVALGVLVSWWVFAAVIAIGVVVWLLDLRTWPTWGRPW